MLNSRLALSFVPALLAALSATAALAQTSKPVKAGYSIPSGPGIEQVLDYTLEPATWRVKNNGKIYIDYTLPEDLIGRSGENMTMFTDEPVDPNATFFHLFCGKTGSEASCTRSGDRVLCTVVYRDLDIKASDVSKLLDKKYGPANLDALRPARIAASAAFAHDAVGSIVIDLK